MSYYDNVNTTLVGLVDSGQHRILELGCGAGAMARAIRARNGGAYYVGVDIAEEPLREAADALDVAVCRNLDEISDWQSDSELAAALPMEFFDYVICGDVLEHLYDPDAVVRQACQRLRPGGAFLTCIPNVQHWSVFAQLIKGSWPRVDSGIFDRTHIRWFAFNDMESMLRNAGLSIEAQVGRVFAEDEGREIAEFLEPLALHLGVDPEQLMTRSLPLQFVFLARKIR